MLPNLFGAVNDLFGFGEVRAAVGDHFDYQIGGSDPMLLLGLGDRLGQVLGSVPLDAVLGKPIALSYVS